MNIHAQNAQDVVLVDPEATDEVRALYANLKSLRGKQILFGHQDALAYGVHWKEWHRSRSDVKDLVGSHPAVIGWELSKLGKYSYNIDSVDFEQMKQWIKRVYKMGGINTVAWHMDNFATGGDTWDTGGDVVKHILPGGIHHDAFRAKLDLFAEFVLDLEVGFFRKRPIPLIFRPYHEHTGSWFWWGRNLCTAEDYKSLWRFTVEYLRDTKGIHNLIYAYSPDVFNTQEDYLERYPGDDYVDIMGLDDYHDLGEGQDHTKLSQRLEMVVELADKRGKVPALTETGQEAIPEHNWWTDALLKNVLSSEKTSSIAYVLVWRNARTTHHYGPFRGHTSAENFKKFVSHPKIWLQKDLPNLYK